MTSRLRFLAALAIALASVLVAQPAAHAQSTCLITEVRWFAGDFEPRNWRFANGQILPIAQNQALFALLGNTYGGDGRTSFALPDLRGRMVIGSGQGPGLTSRSVGEQGGADQITLSADQLPVHTHSVMASGGPPTATDPGGNVWAESLRAPLYDPAAVVVDMSPAAVSAAGGSQPHPNTMPFIVLRPIICTEGIFPSPAPNP